MTKNPALWNGRFRHALPALSVAGFFLAWELLARAGLLSRIFLPAPSIIFAFAVQSTLKGELPAALGTTLGRIAAGFILGGTAGLTLGWAMGTSTRLRRLMDPFIAALHPVPKIAIFPLILFLFGLGETSKIVTIAISAFFPMLINTIAGVRQINPLYIEAAQNYGASRWKTIRSVILPGSLPMALAGMRIALNTSLVIAIAVELVGARRGLGVMIWFAWQTLRIEQLYATLFVIALVGIASNYLLEWASRRLAPWHFFTSPDEGT